MWLVRSFLVVFASSALLPAVVRGQPRVQSTVSTLPVAAATLAGAISISVTSGATQTLSNVVDNAPNTFPSPVSITLTWDLLPQTGSVQVLGYFVNPAAAMIGGAVSIPSSWLKGRVLTAGAQSAPTTYTAFTQSGAGGIGSAGGSLLLFSQPILGYSKTGTRTVDLDLQLDLTGRTLAAGSYSGTLNIRAVSQ